MSDPSAPALSDGSSDDHQDKTGQDETSSSLVPPDIAHLSISSDNLDVKRRPGQNNMRSVSDIGPIRPAPPVSSNLSSGATSPLAHVQAARGLAGRPPSSSGSASSGLSGAVSKLPAGMQAKMMAVRPRPSCPNSNLVPRISVVKIVLSFRCE